MTVDAAWLDSFMSVPDYDGDGHNHPVLVENLDRKLITVYDKNVPLSVEGDDPDIAEHLGIIAVFFPDDQIFLEDDRFVFSPKPNGGVRNGLDIFL